MVHHWKFVAKQGNQSCFSDLLLPNYLQFFQCIFRWFFRVFIFIQPWVIVLNFSIFFSLLFFSYYECMSENKLMLFDNFFSKKKIKNKVNKNLKIIKSKLRKLQIESNRRDASTVRRRRDHRWLDVRRSVGKIIMKFFSCYN